MTENLCVISLTYNHVVEPPTPSRIMALDVGDHHIGIALSDPLGYAAFPLLVLRRTTLRADIKSITSLIRKHEVNEIVIGNPLRRSGETSPRAAKAQAVAHSLAEHLTKENRPASEIPSIQLWDERISAAQPRHHLDATGHHRIQTGRTARRNIAEQLAAVFILQAFIDSRDVLPRSTSPPRTHSV